MKFNIKNLFRKNFSLHPVLKNSLVTAATFFVLLMVTLAVIYIKADDISTFVINKYITSQHNERVSQTEDDTSEVGVDLPQVIQNVFTQESHVVNLVEKTNPAVVSVVVSKNVPVVEQYYSNPFGDLWGNGFSIPQYRQNGTEEKEVGAGSGFIVSSDGLVVTNRHVVSDTDASYTLYANDGKKYDVEVVARDSYLDIAILKIKGGGTFPYLEFGNSNTLKLGQSVVAIGNALGQFRNSVSLGVVSGLSRSVVAGDGQGNSETLEKVIQTDAAINPGNSGGPLLDIDGKVIGVNVAVASGSENIGFALPGNAVKSAVDSVKNTGKITRPYLGVRYLDIDKDFQNKNNIPVDYGVIVVRGQTPSDLAVLPGSPADKAGIKENDIILEIDGVKIEGSQSLISIIQEKEVGQIISMQVMRAGSIITVKATLQESI